MKRYENGFRKLNFNIDIEDAEKFKIHAIKQKKTMTDLFMEMVKKAIELDIYVDLSKENNSKLK